MSKYKYYNKIGTHAIEYAINKMLWSVAVCLSKNDEKVKRLTS